MEIVERSPVSIEFLALDPLFDEEIIGLMRRLLPRERHDDVVTAVVFRARLPEPACGVGAGRSSR